MEYVRGTAAPLLDEFLHSVDKIVLKLDSLHSKVDDFVTQRVNE